MEDTGDVFLFSLAEQGSNLFITRLLYIEENLCIRQRFDTNPSPEQIKRTRTYAAVSGLVFQRFTQTLNTRLAALVPGADASMVREVFFIHCPQYFTYPSVCSLWPEFMALDADRSHAIHTQSVYAHCPLKARYGYCGKKRAPENRQPNVKRAKPSKADAPAEASPSSTSSSSSSSSSSGTTESSGLPELPAAIPLGNVSSFQDPDFETLVSTEECTDWSFDETLLDLTVMTPFDMNLILQTTYAEAAQGTAPSIVQEATDVPVPEAAPIQTCVSTAPPLIVSSHDTPTPTDEEVVVQITPPPQRTDTPEITETSPETPELTAASPETVAAPSEVSMVPVSDSIFQSLLSMSFPSLATLPHTDLVNLVDRLRFLKERPEMAHDLVSLVLMLK